MVSYPLHAMPGFHFFLGQRNDSITNKIVHTWTFRERFVKSLPEIIPGRTAKFHIKMKEKLQSEGRRKDQTCNAFLELLNQKCYASLT